MHSNLDAATGSGFTEAVDGARRGITLATDEAGREGAPLRLRLKDGREIVIDRRLVVGTSPESDVVLDDPYVSGTHCVLSRTGSRTVVADCGSRNGTFVEDVRVDRGTLRSGSKLTIGRTPLRVVATGVADPRVDEGPAGIFCELLGQSPSMRQLAKDLQRIATSSAPVLLLGESGTGKELAARAVHERSGRKGPFVAINCGAIAPDLVESELFGHERGAFTGAAARRVGVFEEADGGTLFLDEIAELPLTLQPRLLRVLETSSIRPVGGNGERRVDVRIVAATHRDLRSAIDERDFRLDLFHRLAIFSVRLPPLRQRTEDIPLLARHFLEELAAESGQKTLSPRALEMLLALPWPGNVRELKNALRRASVLGGEVIEPEDLFPAVDVAGPPLHESVYRPSAGRRLDEVERELIARELRLHKGNRRAAASALGIAKSTLCDKVRRYGLTP